VEQNVIKTLAAISVFLSFFILGTAQLQAQKRLTLNTAPQDFQTFYAEFKAAVLKRDKSKVASMTRFPLVTGIVPGEPDFQYTTSKEDFLASFDNGEFADRLGGARLFSQNNPAVFDFGSDTYCLINRIDTEFSHLIFKKSGTSYQFTSLVNFVEVSLNHALPEFREFYGKFSTAILKRDRNAVAAMTKFPFKYGYDAGDEGTYTRAQFLRRFDLSDHDVFRQKDPTLAFQNGSYLISSEDAAHYTFDWDGKSYLFTAFMVEP
jgi:hypothetical protein